MNDADIEAVVAQLEAAAPKDAAQVELQYGEDVEGVHLVANRAGFVRLALEFLRAATAPIPAGREVLDVDWKYLFVKGSGAFSRISRTESVVLPDAAPLTRREKVTNIAWTIVALGFIVFLVISTMVGCFTILGRIPSYWR